MFLLRQSAMKFLSSSVHSDGCLNIPFAARIGAWLRISLTARTQPRPAAGQGGGGYSGGGYSGGGRRDGGGRGGYSSGPKRVGGDHGGRSFSSGFSCNPFANL